MDMDRAVDILHPLASLEWTECRGPPLSVGSIILTLIGTQAVWLKDKVYVGGGGISGSLRDKARLYIYTPATDTWTTLDTPVCCFALTTYHSQLVLVSGTEYVDESVKGEHTNKLWTLNEDGQWQETLPPMPLHHGSLVRLTSAVSHGDHLLVINEEYPNNKVYVYNGHNWARAQHPPQWLYSIKSTIVSGHYYLMGNEGLTFVPQKTCVYSVSLDSLLASCQPSETSQPSSLWKRLTDIPSERCYPVVFGNRLVAIGERSSPTPTSLYAYSSFIQSWLHIGDAPVPSTGGFPCAVVLPSNELMVVRGQTAFKAILKMTPFNPESSFSMRAVSLLEAAASIPVMRTLSDYTRHIQIFLGLHQYTNLDLINQWISNVPWVRPTWKNLLLILRLLNLDELAQRMETYLSGVMEEPHEGPEVEMEGITGEKESEEFKLKLRLREETIYRLKQEMASLREEKDTTIFTLEEKIKEFKSQVLIKKEDVEEKPVSLLLTKTEIKEEPLTPEGELLTFPSAKTEFKEEAVTMTKSETMSAQPTTAIWNLRGVEVCGEMAVVVYSSHDQQITMPSYGLKLNIPKGCLPAGMEQCTINIKASLAGQYEFPENSHLVSAVFWLCCEDVHKFTTPISVEIQHRAKPGNIANPLSFVRAICSQKQLPYTFKQLSGGNFTSHSSYGVIELHSFSQGVGVTQEGLEHREYCSQLFYLGQPNWCEIYYVVTWNTEAHLTLVKDEYIAKGAIPGPHQSIEFESDAISLDIPLEGMNTKGWKITPLIRPVVTKNQVDNFREGKLTPCCQLLAKFSERTKEIPSLEYQVNLKGALYPHDFFVINLPARDPNQQERSQTFGDLIAASPPPTKRSRSGFDESAFLVDFKSTETLPQTNTATSASLAGPSVVTHATKTVGMDTKLMKPELKDLIKELLTKASDKWENIGILLGIEPGRLDAIKAAESLPQNCLREMLKIWLKSAPSTRPSWSAIADAIDLLGDQNLADHLRTKYHISKPQI